MSTCLNSIGNLWWLNYCNSKDVFISWRQMENLRHIVHIFVVTICVTYKLNQFSLFCMRIHSTHQVQIFAEAKKDCNDTMWFRRGCLLRLQMLYVWLNWLNNERHTILWVFPPALCTTRRNKALLLSLNPMYILKMKMLKILNISRMYNYFMLC